MAFKTTLVLVTLALVARCQSPHVSAGGAEAVPLVSASALVGAWNGEWMVSPGVAQGMVELVLTRAPGRDSVLGQFTFLTGAVSRTVRYEGRVENGTLRFPLVGEGRIVLEPREAARPGGAARLQGEWVDTRGALPAPHGTLQLSRTAMR